MRYLPKIGAHSPDIALTRLCPQLVLQIIADSPSKGYRARTLPQVVAESAATFGDRVAISDGDVQLTYAELDVARVRSAQAFLAAGIEKGDRIAIWAPNIYQWIIAAIGAQSVGGVLVPLNTRLKGAEAAYILRASGARLLFTVGEFLGVTTRICCRARTCRRWSRWYCCAGSAQVAPPGTIFWQRESCCTGAVARVLPLSRPMIPWISCLPPVPPASPRAWSPVMARTFAPLRTGAPRSACRSDDNYLIINPFFHSFGYKAGWLACIIRGARMLPVKSFDLDEVLAPIPREQISMIPGPPTIYQSLLAHPRRGEYDLSSLRLAVTGAAPVPVALVEQMREELGFEVVVTAYGLTETCGVVSICRPDDSAERISHSSGRAMDGVEMKCVDAAGNDVATGDRGEIWCRGFNVMRGYLDNPEETARAITADGWLQTGDVGVMDEDGYVRITDRIKDMFIVGGFNCYPAEIENSLCSMPGVARAAVIGVPDERLGEVALAYIVPAPVQSWMKRPLSTGAASNMANYKVPRRCAFWKSFP